MTKLMIVIITMKFTSGEAYDFNFAHFCLSNKINKNKKIEGGNDIKPFVHTSISNASHT